MEAIILEAREKTVKIGYKESNKLIQNTQMSVITRFFNVRWNLDHIWFQVGMQNNRLPTFKM